MDKKSDAILRKELKKWVNRYRAPENGRARLLWEAAHLSRSKIDLAALFFRHQFTSNSSSSTNDWHQTLFAWIHENTIQYGIQPRLA